MNCKFKRAAIWATLLIICAWTLPEVLIFTDAIARAQDLPQYGTPFSDVPDPRDVNMYQVHIRPYSAAGDLAGVIARLDNIRALGINVIYLMPVYPNGGPDPRSRPSPYCITDFKSVASEYGTLADLRALVDGAHSRGMAVILDFAVNGTSWDHPWITQHPDWYVRVNGVIQRLATFDDVAALNFNNTEMRAALVDAMRYWIFAANIDGYRCDFANNPPLDFWRDTINNLRSITTHKLLLFAEGDRLENFQVGFDLNFGDKWYYDAISRIATGTSVAQIQTTTNTEYTYATGNQQVVRYTSNHDRMGEITPFSVFQNHDGVVVNFLVSAYMRGVPFLTSGQEVDFNQTIPWPYQTVKIDFNANPGAAADFAKVLNFRTSSDAIRRGTMTNYSDDNVCAFTKIYSSEKVVVIANLRNGTYNYTIPSAFAGNYEDAYSGSSVTLTAGETQSLAAFRYIVLTNAGVESVPVTGVTVTPTSASISVGLTRQLTEIVVPSNATNQNVTWTSSNTSVATVSGTGLVAAVAAGNATITVTTEDGNKTATCAITVTPAVVTYYNLANRWHPEYYLYDGGNGQVKYGSNPGGNSLYQWTRVDAGNGFVRLKNRSTGNFMHVENQNGSVQCGVVGSDWYSAQWAIANATDGWNYIQNRWQPNEWIHIENLLGYAQYAYPQYGWYSAMWRFVNPVVCPR
jgi:glycosidase